MSAIKRRKALEDEDAKLKKLVADQMMERLCVDLASVVRRAVWV